MTGLSAKWRMTSGALLEGAKRISAGLVCGGNVCSLSLERNVLRLFANPLLASEVEF